MDGPRLWDRRVRAEALRGYPLEDVVRRLGYRRDPADAARWRRLGSVVSINGFMFYDHLRGQGGGGAIDLVIHARRCSPAEALAFLSKLPCHSRLPANRRHPGPPRSDRHWAAVQRCLVDKRGLSTVLLALCRDLGLVHADRYGNPVFVRRNAAGEATGTEIVPAAGAHRPAPSPAARGGFRMSWDPDWPNSVILAKSAIDALSVLSLHLVPAERKGCAVVSTGGANASLPEWIKAWNPGRIFCAYDATRQGDDAAARLIRK